MSKTFRDWNVDQPWLLPPSVNDFVPADHVAHFVRETVREGLDLRLIYLSYKGERGQPPSRPAIEGRGSVPITATWYKTAFADPLKDLSDPSIQDAMTLAYTGYGCLTYCRQHFLQIMVATELEFLGVN